MKKHGKQACPYCDTLINGFHKSLERHLRSRHADRPEVRNNPKIWKEQVSCEGCGKQMRADNFKRRHIKKCKGMKNVVTRETNAG